MAMTNFPTNFPSGPLVDLRTGRMAPGPSGIYFLLALFNRTGGPGGITPPAPTTDLAAQACNGLTVAALQGVPMTQPTTRQVLDGLTIEMLPPDA